MASVVKALQNEEAFETVVCVTAQHREMLDQVLGLFDIVPDYDLDLMSPGQDLTDITGRVLTGLRDVLRESKPARILVHGDTTTTFAAALAGYYEKIPVGHVEAGLRTGDVYAPWPEEMNRSLTGRIADLHFAPTAGARENLLAESINSQSILVTGNTVIDALLSVAVDLDRGDDHGYDLVSIRELFSKAPKTILVTGHRRENFGAPFLSFCNALAQIAQEEGVQLVYPVHLNPNVQEPVNRILGNIENIHLIAPQDYLPFVEMMRLSHFVITDSGGMQEEAPALGKPVLVTRDVTERPEAVDAGTAILVGTDQDTIISEALRLLNDDEYYSAMARAKNPFGDGTAAQQIVKRLLEEI